MIHRLCTALARRSSHHFLMTAAAAFLCAASALAEAATLPETFVKNLHAGRHQTIVAYGTSLTAAAEWPKALAAYFDREFPGQVSFVNAAQSGQHSNWGVEHLAERVLAQKPDLVFLEFSVNDAATKHHISPEQSAANLDHIVRALRAQNPQVDIVLQTMNPAWDSPTEPSGKKYGSDRPDLEPYYAVYRRYAQEHGLPLIDNLPAWQKVQRDNLAEFQRLVADGIHPIPEGSLAITWPAIKALLEETCTATAGRPGTLHAFVAPQTLRSDEVTLLWDKPAGATPGLIYEILKNGAPIDETTKTHFTVRALTPSTRYVFAVRTKPAAGPKSEGRANPPGEPRAATRPSALSLDLALQTAPREPVVDVLAFGAVGDGATLNTKAIQAAIAACPPGGIVRIPAGVFLSGALFLKSDMTLEIAAGGVLKGSANPADYEPYILNRFEGWEMKTLASLLNAGTLDRSGPANVRNISIRGSGTLSGGGRALSDTVRKAFPGVQGLRSRGRLVCLMNADGVEIQGLTIEESPCWTLHFIYSDNITCRGLAIRSDVLNGDGIDPDSARNVAIVDCSFDTGDDCIAVKSGKNPEGNVVARPTEDVRVVDCRFARGHGISIGSETSGGVRGVLVEDCVAGELLNGLQIKATKDRGNTIEDIAVRDCDLRKITILTALPYNNDGAPAPDIPFFRDFAFRNLDLSHADVSKPVIVVNGFEAAGHRTKNLVFENLRLPAGATVTVDLAEDVRFTNVTAPDGAKPTYQVTRSERVAY
ncbi:MAG: glycosyl hydrolase family 28 protein [Opitutaceae bacterium]